MDIALPDSEPFDRLDCYAGNRSLRKRGRARPYVSRCNQAVGRPDSGRRPAAELRIEKGELRICGLPVGGLKLAAPTFRNAAPRRGAYLRASTDRQQTPRRSSAS